MQQTLHQNSWGLDTHKVTEQTPTGSNEQTHTPEIQRLTDELNPPTPVQGKQDQVEEKHELNRGELNTD